MILEAVLSSSSRSPSPSSMVSLVDDELVTTVVPTFFFNLFKMFETTLDSSSSKAVVVDAVEDESRTLKNIDNVNFREQISEHFS